MKTTIVTMTCQRIVWRIVLYAVKKMTTNKLKTGSHVKNAHSGFMLSVYQSTTLTRLKIQTFIVIFVFLEDYIFFDSILSFLSMCVCVIVYLLIAIPYLCTFL